MSTKEDKELSLPPAEIETHATLKADRFPELSDEENGIIRIARERGFAKYWPAFPGATVQARNTFNGAMAWIESAPAMCPSCISGEAHNH